MNETDTAAVLINWAGVVFGALATLIGTWHFKGKEHIRTQLQKNTMDIKSLDQTQKSDTQLLTQKMASVEVELRDMKDSVKVELGEIKTMVNTLNASLMGIAVSMGELSGKIKD